MCKDKINKIKILIGNQNSQALQSELRRLEYTLRYIEGLTDVGSYIPGIKKYSINYVKKFLDTVEAKVVFSLKLCPLQGLVGVCSQLILDFSPYVQEIGKFLSNDVKNGLINFKKYEPFDTSLTSIIPELDKWNLPFINGNNLVRQAMATALEQIGNGLQATDQNFTGILEACAIPPP